MRRSRSPIRFKRERSPSIVSILQSRELSRERSFSISSLSSCSLGHTFEQSFDKSSKNYGDINKKGNPSINRSEEDNRRSRRHGKIESNTRHDKKEIDRERFGARDSDGNYSKGIDKLKRRKTNSRGDEATCPGIQRQGGVEMSDPSVTFQEQAAFQLQSGLEVDNHSSNRLDRLEKMLEKLLQRKIQQQQPNSSGFVSENSENPFELNPRNTAFTTSMWLNKINEECIEKDYDEKTCIQFLQSRMSGLIKAWFKTLDIFEYSWPEIKMLIIRTFPDNTDFSTTLRLLVDRYKQPEESITQYYFSKMYLLEACKITGVNAVSCLIDGLSDVFLQQEAKGHNFLTPETLYSHFFTKLPNFGIQQSHITPEITSKDDCTEYIELHELNTNNQPSRHNNVPAPQPTRFIKKKCFTCKKFGHIAADCRHAPLCYACNEIGHIAAKCPRK